MNYSEVQSVKKMISLTAAFYGLEVDDDIVAMNAEDLIDQDYGAVCEVFKNLRRDPKYNKNNIFPISPKILERLQTPVTETDEAREVAARIITAMSRFGYTNPEQAKAFIGELGWEVVSLQGGWIRICQETKRDELPTLQAQWRDLAISISHKYRAGMANTPPALPGAEKKFALNIAKPGLALIDK